MFAQHAYFSAEKLLCSARRPVQCFSNTIPMFLGNYIPASFIAINKINTPSIVVTVVQYVGWL